MKQLERPAKVCDESDVPDLSGRRRDRERVLLALAIQAELARLAEDICAERAWRPFAVVDRRGRVLAGNRPLLELLGRDEQDVLGTAWDQVMPDWRELVAPWTVRPGCRWPERRLRTTLRFRNGRGNDDLVAATTIARAVPLEGGEPLAFTFLLAVT